MTTSAAAPKVAVIGAGMAGLICARALADAGVDVRVFDKARGPGGRMSTRRCDTPHGEICFDHGAPMFAARSEELRAEVRRWLDAGVVAPWTGRLVHRRADGASSAVHHPRYVGVPRMSALLAHLAQGLDVRLNARVEAVTGVAPALTIDLDDGRREGPYDFVLTSLPAEQTATFLSTSAPALAATAAAARTAPCWVGMLAWEERLDVDFDAARLEDDAVLSFLGRDASKPGRAPAETWVAHASPAWSRAHLEDSRDHVAAMLARASASILNTPMATFMDAHRWRYALVEVAAGVACALDEQRGIGTCGDWHLGVGVEHAWTSGRALAARVLALTRPRDRAHGAGSG